MTLPRIEWTELPLQAMNIKSMLDCCETVADLSEATILFLIEIDETEDRRWAEMAKKIFYPLYEAITGMDYDTPKFKIC